MKVPGKYTLGGMFTHAWSFAGDDERACVSMTTLLPAATYVLGRGASVSLASETTYNWKLDEDNWTIPLTLGVGPILPPFGKFFVGVAVAGSYYVERSDNAQECDVRGTVSLVMP